MQTIQAKIIQGHRVASGKGGDARFPGGTIRMQTPFFKALGLDLAPYYPGTLNVSVAPYRYEIVKPAYTFRQVKWGDALPAENFSFFHVRRVLADGSKVDGLVYYPHPETKSEHFQPKDMLELLFPKMDDVVYGDAMTIELDENEIRLVEDRP